MKPPLKSVVEEFGYLPKAGSIIACLTALEDRHPKLKTKLPCFAEFSYEHMDKSEQGHLDYFDFDKIINVRLAINYGLQCAGVQEFEFEKANVGAQVVCLFCGDVVGSITISRGAPAIRLDFICVTHLPTRATNKYFNHLSLAEQELYAMRDFTREVFSSRQRQCFPANFKIPETIPMGLKKRVRFV